MSKLIWIGLLWLVCFWGGIGLGVWIERDARQRAQAHAAARFGLRTGSAEVGTKFIWDSRGISAIGVPQISAAPIEPEPSADEL